MTKKMHFEALDGLRGLAAICVVLYHRRAWAPGGEFMEHAWLAVDFFFVLSGFVVDYAYAAKIRAGLKFSSFVRLRIVRLYPLIMIGAAIGFSWPMFLFLKGYGEVRIGASALSAVANGLALPSVPALLREPFDINPPVWSLFFELCANLAYAALIARLSVRSLASLVVVAALIEVAMVAHVGTINTGNTYATFWWGFPRVLFPFTLGVLLSRLRHRIKLPALSFPLASIILLLIFASPTLGDFEFLFELVAVLGVLPAIMIAAHEREPGRRWHRIVKGSAFISYPVYAVHDPVLQWMDPFRAHISAPGWVWLGVGTLSAIIVAWISGNLLEPMLRKALTFAIPGGSTSRG